MNIYGLLNKNPDVSSSYVADGNDKIDLNNTPRITSEHSIKEPKLYGLYIPTLQPGVYEGWIFVKDKNTSTIPITIATQPKVNSALLWVVIGILTSIIFWEIINYIAQVKNSQKNGGTPQVVRARISEYVDTRLASKNFVKIATIDAGTIGFGIAVGFLALLTQGYVTAIRIIQPIDIAALIGLGLGIGSLREFVNKNS